MTSWAPFQNQQLNIIFFQNPDEATIFQFIVAPNTEINQLRFDNNKYVVSYESDGDFDDGEGRPVIKFGYETNPLTSCFKAYKFLSNVQ